MRRDLIICILFPIVPWLLVGIGEGFLFSDLNGFTQEKVICRTASAGALALSLSSPTRVAENSAALAFFFVWSAEQVTD